MKPYYEDGQAVIYHGDCRTVNAWVEADVLVTDPPYGIDYQTHAPRREGNPRSIAGDADCSLRDEVLACWAGRPALVFGTWKRPKPADVRTVLAWDQGGALGMGDLSLPWKPSWQEIYVIGKGWVGSRDCGSVLRFPPVQAMASNGRVHPHEKPVSLMHALLAKCPEGTVLDPFMGSGSTLVAAKAQGRRCIGVEVDERYCEIAAKRLSQGVLDFSASPAVTDVQTEAQ